MKVRTRARVSLTIVVDGSVNVPSNDDFTLRELQRMLRRNVLGTVDGIHLNGAIVEGSPKIDLIEVRDEEAA